MPKSNHPNTNTDAPREMGTPQFPETVAIVGVGLIGGSIAAALQKRWASVRVIGVGRDRQRLTAAVEMGLLDEVTDQLTDAAKQADLLIFCTPVDVIVAGIREAAAACRPGTLITDVGSTKTVICRQLGGAKFPDGVTFIGSHPLAGSEKQGFEYANADLFCGQRCVITPLEKTDEKQIATLENFWATLEMNVVRTTPEEHDRILSVTSHLPHLLASALTLLLDDKISSFTASGFRDTTRIAASDPALWAAIFESNATAVTTQLDQLITIFEKFREQITKQQREPLQKLLQLAKTKRDALDG